ncbi:unnamed protein product [Darwinula stevensoni]|uniref:Phosphate acetyl/butaryl transferase domain-containing protein n=1 Tax=Darwinula stevensoni TaxID=69355 RepID=A0A7R9FUZ3_9CRUS|nr:unnamed protein product [Darwinula stevensoni]CAG0909303.1 unnamed protein product [Darwinula stevensoni]
MGKVLSHCALVAAPTYGRRVLVTDAAMNMAPDATQKKGICQNAIHLALALGIAQPKVAVIAAVEVMNTRMQATIDAAILAKMADRRQIVGGIVDGPLDLDAAVSSESARIKHIDSPVAGVADILLAHDIETGNALYKVFAFMSGAQTAGVIMGARVPIVLTSRADDALSRLYSTALACQHAHALAQQPELFVTPTE